LLQLLLYDLVIDVFAQVADADQSIVIEIGFPAVEPLYQITREY